MNNRLTIQDLAALLPEYAGKDKKEVERFLKEFIAVVSEGVCTDKLVKVKGLGTFKIVLVDKRESIHVNTGERFLIPAHYKFSFLPDKDLREQVNKPFSFFETTEINENVDFSDIIQSEEDEKEDEKEAENENESVEEVMPDKEIPLEDIPLPSPVEQPVEVSTPIPPPKEEPTPEVIPEPEELPEPEVKPEPEELPEEPEPAKIPRPIEPIPQRSSGKALRVMLVIAAVIICAVYFYVGVMPVFTTDRSIVKDTLANVPENLVVDKPIQEDTVVKAPESQAEAVAEAVASPPPQILEKVKIARGDRLTLIALEHYGNKIFWVYLYQHNKQVIENPNNVPIGTVIEIPSPKLYGIDANSRESREKAATLQTEILTLK